MHDEVFNERFQQKSCTVEPNHKKQMDDDQEFDQFENNENQLLEPLHDEEIQFDEPQVPELGQ